MGWWVEGGKNAVQKHHHIGSRHGPSGKHVCGDLASKNPLYWQDFSGKPQYIWGNL
jgi:hypothetical protein